MDCKFNIFTENCAEFIKIQYKSLSLIVLVYNEFLHAGNICEQMGLSLFDFNNSSSAVSARRFIADTEGEPAEISLILNSAPLIGPYYHPHLAKSLIQSSSNPELVADFLHMIDQFKDLPSLLAKRVHDNIMRCQNLGK
jgi:hypothetical protein